MVKTSFYASNMLIVDFCRDTLCANNTGSSSGGGGGLR